MVWEQLCKKVNTSHCVSEERQSPDVEVLHIDIPVGGSLSLAPKQQALFSRCL